MRQSGRGGFDGEEPGWVKSQQYYDRALKLRPNAVPVLQNIGTLRLAQAKSAENDGQQERAADLRDEAKALYLQSLEINDHDQFPYYQLAGIAVQRRNKQEALERIRVGRSKPGAVKDVEWNEVFSEALALPETVV